jgi:hypothetical protein
MPTEAGSFFPPEYKQFPFKEGDLLVSRRNDGKFAVNKILKVDRFDFRKGSSISIQGQVFTATEDDYLLVVSVALGDYLFSSMDDARAAARAGTWKAKVRHIPNRPPGAAAGQVLVGNAPVTDAELEGYRIWKAEFEKGKAGIF